MKYAADCEQAFGYFLHHYPYVGMRGVEDEQFRVDSGERMRELYEATFGEAYPAMGAGSDGEARTAYCAGPDNKRLGGHSDVLGQATAYCAGPDSKLRNLLNPIRSAEIAYCAGPDSKRLSTDATAYCAGPDGKLRSRIA
jgi:hypothetical protein